jgi:hypothetical protein
MSSTKLKNPFDDDDLVVHDAADPFADPSITDALQNSNIELESSALLSHQSSTTTTTTTAKQSTVNNAYAAHTTSKPTKPMTGFGSSKNGGDNDASLSAREAELRRREEELAERERRLREEAEAIRTTPGILRAPNFPPCYPLYYLDIDVEIPEMERPIVRRLYQSWLATVATLFWNAIACFMILVSHATGVTTGATDFGVAFVYCFTMTAASFYLWYRPIYNAYMKERSMYYCK